MHFLIGSASEVPGVPNELPVSRSFSDDPKMLISHQPIEVSNGEDTGTFLCGIQSLVLPFVTETRMPSAWKPDPRHAYSPPWLERMESLNIPLWDQKPSMLLHRLGSFENNPILQDRLANIFMAKRQKWAVSTLWSLLLTLGIASFSIRLVLGKLR